MTHSEGASPPDRARRVSTHPTALGKPVRRSASPPERPRLSTSARETAGLRDIANSVTEEPYAILLGLLTAAVELCGGGAETSSAGVSLLEDTPEGGQQFRWVAMSGCLAAHVGGTTPREFSPCGECLDHGGPIILKRPDLKFPYFGAAGIEFTEGLVVPFNDTVRGTSLGTIWVVSHPPLRQRFGPEDVALMERLTGFAASVYRLAIVATSAEGTRRTYRNVVAGVSREMRSPLNTIAGCMEVLTLDAQAGLTAAQLDSIARTSKAVKLLLAGVNALSESGSNCLLSASALVT